MHIKKLQHKEKVQDKFAVTGIKKLTTKEGKPYLNVDLSHPTGTIIGKVWQEVMENVSLAVGHVYELQGIANNYQQKIELIINQADKVDEAIENLLYQKPTLVFDIETAGQNFEELSEWDQDYLLNTLQRHDEDKEAAKQKTALYPLYGQVVAIGMQNPVSKKGFIYAQSQKKLVAKNDRYQYQNFHDEKMLLEAFWALIPNYERFVTFNGLGFDMPYLQFRSAVNKVKVTLDFDYRQENHIDLMIKFKGSGLYKLEALCRAFKIHNPKEEGVSGLHVSHLFKEGKIQDIADYVSRDVDSTSQLYDLWRTYMTTKIDA